jgi:hypothetical protein
MKIVTLKEHTAKTRKHFGRLDQEAIGKWLWKGLSTLYSSAPLYSYKGFAPADGYMGFGESNLDDLRKIYESIFDEQTKKRFRQSIGDLLVAHKNDTKVPYEVIRDLIYLIERAGAVESLASLSLAVGEGSITKKHPEFVYEAISVLMAFTYPPRETQPAMIALVKANHFREDFIFQIAEGLGRCGFSKHDEFFGELKKRLDRLYRQARKNGGKDFATVKEFAADVLFYTPAKR